MILKSLQSAFLWLIQDVNGNGMWESGESGLSGLVFNLADPVSGSQTTGAGGAYTFSNLNASGPYTITEVFKPVWTQATPNPNFSLDLAQNLTDQNIGNACFVGTGGMSM